MHLNYCAWPYAIVTTCCPISTLRRGLNLYCTLVDVTSLCHMVWLPRFIELSFRDTKRSIMRRFHRRLCDDLMGSRYPRLVRCLSSYVVRLVTCNSTNDSIIGLVSAVPFGSSYVKDICRLAARRTVSILQSPWPSHYFSQTPPVFAYYSRYNSNQFTREELVWRIAAWGLEVCPFISFLVLACTGTSA